MTHRALKRRPSWLLPPDLRTLRGPLPWLIVLALVTVLGGVGLIARLALTMASPQISRYTGDLAARGGTDYSFWALGPLIPPINPEVIVAAEAENNAPPPSQQGPQDSVPIAVVSAPTSTPTVATAQPPTPTASPSPSPTATEAPPSPTMSPVPPTTTPTPTRTHTSTSTPQQAPTAVPTTTRQPTSTALAPSSTPVTAPELPPATATRVPPSPTATRTPVPPTATRPPAPPSATPTNTAMAAPPSATSTPVMPTATLAPLPVVSFANTVISVAESDRKVTVELLLDRSHAQAVTVSYTTRAGSATAGADYTTTTGTLTFNPADRARSFTIPIVEDTLNETLENFTLQLSAVEKGVLDPISIATVMITDANGPPTVSFSGTGRTVGEGAGSAAATIQLSAASALDVTIPYLVQGADLSDHSLRAGTIVIAAGQTSARVRFGIVDDRLDEDDESIDIRLLPPNNAALGGTTLYSITVADNDTAGVRVTPTSFRLGEGQSATYSVVLESQPTNPVTINLQADGQVRSTLTQLIFSAQNWNVLQSVTLTALDDFVDEATTHAGSLVHVATSGDARYNGISIAPITIQIRDDDTAGVSVSETAITPAEAGSPATYTVRLNSQPVGTVTVNLSHNAQVSASPASLTFTDADWNIPQTVTVTATDDAIDENDEQNRATIRHRVASDDLRYDGIGVASVSVTITDNDAAGVSVSTTALTAAEGGSPVTYTVRLNSQPVSTVTVELSTAQTGVITTSATSLSFSAANWFKDQTVTVTATDNFIDAPDATATISHTLKSTDPNYNSAPLPLNTPTVDVTVIDDDTTGVTIEPVALTVTEGGITSYTVRLTSEPTSTVTINLSTASTDVITTSAASLSFSAADWFKDQTVTVTATDNFIDAPDATATISHTVKSTDQNSTYNGTKADTVTVTITDNDTAGVSIDPIAQTVTEGGVTSYTARLTSKPIGTVTVNLSTPATGVISTDVVSLTFSAANWSEDQTITVTALDNFIDAPDATATISHTMTSDDPAYSAIPLATIAVTITDDDTAGLVVSDLSGVQTSESGEAVSFGVRLTSQPLAPVALGIVIDHPAEATVSSPSQPIVFDAANWSQPVTVSVTGQDDNDFDGPVTYMLQFGLTGDRAYTDLPSESLPTLALENADNEPALASVGDPALSEGNTGLSELRFPVSLSRPTVAPVSITYETYGLSATSGEDFLAASGTLVIGQGESSGAISVFLVGDTAYEPDELVAVRLTGATATGDLAEIEDSQGIGVIRNDDAQGARFATADALVLENAGTATVTVRLDAPFATPVTVSYRSIDGGSAIAGQDYVTTSGNLTFAPGQTEQTLAISILNNDGTADERYETVRLELSKNNGAEIGTPGTVSLTIVEDSLGSPFASSTFVITVGPDAPPDHGNWYTSAANRGGSNYFQLIVPCGWPAGQPLAVELWSAGMHTGAGSQDIALSSTPVTSPGSTTFELYDAGTTVQADGHSPAPGALGSLYAATYPVSTAAEGWESFYTLPSPTPCGRYVLRVRGSGTDQNQWAVRTNSPSVVFGTLLSTLQQMTPGKLRACLTSWVYVPAGTALLRLSNFDLDGPPPAGSGLGAPSDPEARIKYYSPDEPYDPRGQVGGTTGTVSPNAMWAENTIASPADGWWRVVTCIGWRNRFIVEAHVDGALAPLLHEPPPAAPALAGTLTLVPGALTPGEQVSVTASYEVPAGEPARDVVLSVALPPELSFAGDPCAATPLPCTFTERTLVLRAGDVGPGQSGAYSFAATVRPDASVQPLAAQLTATYADALGFRHSFRAVATAQVE